MNVFGFSDDYFELAKALGAQQPVFGVNMLGYYEGENPLYSIEEIADPVIMDQFRDCIEFKNVSFSYEDKIILQDINLKIEKRKKPSHWWVHQGRVKVHWLISFPAFMIQ